MVLRLLRHVSIDGVVLWMSRTTYSKMTHGKIVLCKSPPPLGCLVDRNGIVPVSLEASLMDMLSFPLRSKAAIREFDMPLMTAGGFTVDPKNIARLWYTGIHTIIPTK